MAFHHRKLLNASLVISANITDFCQPYCDIDDDHGDNHHKGICPFPCISLCYPTCNTPLLEIPPPPQGLPEPPVDVPYVTPNKAAYNKLSLLLTVSLAVLATAFFFLTCYTIYKLCSSCYNARRRRRLMETRGLGGGANGDDDDDYLDEDRVDHPIWYIRTVGLQPSVISAISIVKYKKGDGLIEGTDCSVCLSEFQEDETLRLLPKCNHAFHIPCIDTWLRSHTNCPLCRARIVKSVGQQDLVVQGLGRAVEEAHGGASGRSGRVASRRESENGDDSFEMRNGIEEDNESQPRLGLKFNDDLGEVEDGGISSDGGGLEGVQPMRRSVSVDSLSASVISAAVKSGQSDGGKSGDHVVRDKLPKRVGSNLSLSGLVGSSSSSNQTGPSSVRRSFSCTAKVFLSRYSNGGSSSRNRNSVVPQ